MNTIVSVPFDSELAEFIGKKGSENSITFFNRKYGEHTVVALQPSSLEEKFYALPQSMLIADQILISTKTVDKDFGEALIAASLLNKRTIFTTDNDISKLLATVKSDKFSFGEKENLLDMLVSNKNESASQGKRIDIDKAFNVKGIGTVVLGIVTKGTVKVHDNLNHNSGKAVTIRSMQSQDIDVKEAGPGTRVGLALKGIDEEELSKGDILSDVPPKSGKHLELEVNKSGFVNESIEKGKGYSIATGFSYSTMIIESYEGSNATVKLEKTITAEIGDNFILVRAVPPMIFASGKINSIYD